MTHALISSSVDGITRRARHAPCTRRAAPPRAAWVLTSLHLKEGKMLCTKHTHSSEATARACADRSSQKKGERRARYFQLDKEIFIKHSPPRKALRGSVEIFVFAEGTRTRY